MGLVKRHLYIGLLCGLAAFLISLLPIVELIELKGYDLLHLFKKPNPSAEEIVIVGIDEPSFAEIGRQWPWPRSLHARLVDNLRKEGAAVIGLDIIFAEPSSPEEDRALSDAIKATGNVVLASDKMTVSGKSYMQEMLIEPIPLIRKSAAVGLTTIELDRDNVVRRFYSRKHGEKSFSEQVAGAHAEKIHREPAGSLIAYSGPPQTFPTISYYQALEPASHLPKNFLKGRIVLVGKTVIATPEPEKASADYFATPFFFSGKGGLMSGVEIHANMVLNFITGSFVSKMGRAGTFLFFMLVGVAGSILQLGWRPVLSGLIAVIAFLLYLALAGLSFLKYNLWLPTFAVALPFFLPYATYGIRSYLYSERKRKEIKNAFSHYLSPSVLETILADPEKLRLGGDRVEATILFSDIVSFTTISEAMRAEEVSDLINKYLNEMTRIITAHNGTIDKFIGDAIMAFWGAPVADPDHALNACRAAVAMQERMKLVRMEFTEKGLPEIFIRIGINTGPVIAGNMGSSDLFDYTVLGDPVNLASRLEGANKEFGTSIMISQAVYEKARGGIVARPLGAIKVKGKTKEVEVYELVSCRG